MKTRTKLLPMAVFLALGAAHAGDILVIGHGNVPPLDPPVIEKIFTGRIISVDGVDIAPVSLKPGMRERDRFLQRFLGQDEDKFTAYWTVRRYIGKGAPPPVFPSTEALITHIQTTPGAVGFIEETELPAGIQVLARQ